MSLGGMFMRAFFTDEFVGRHPAFRILVTGTTLGTLYLFAVSNVVLTSAAETLYPRDRVDFTRWLCVDPCGVLDDYVPEGIV